MAQTENSTTPKKAVVASAAPRAYHLVSVEKTQVPEGGGNENWYRYLLDDGRSTISGVRCGNLKEVTAYATQYAEQLNSRNTNGQCAWSPRSKKRA